MQLISRKNFLIFLASILVVAIGVMAIKSSRQKAPSPRTSEFDQEIKEIKTQSSSDQIEDIDKDLKETDLTNIDKEVQDIENELNTTY